MSFNFKQHQGGLYLTLVSCHGDAEVFTQSRIRFDDTEIGREQLRIVVDALELCSSKETDPQSIAKMESQKLPGAWERSDDLEAVLKKLIPIDVIEFNTPEHRGSLRSLLSPETRQTPRAIPLSVVIERIDRDGLLTVANFIGKDGIERPYKELGSWPVLQARLRESSQALGFEAPKGSTPSHRESWREVGHFAGDAYITVWVNREDGVEGTPTIGGAAAPRNVYLAKEGITPPAPKECGFKSLAEAMAAKSIDALTGYAPTAIPDGWICASSQCKDWKYGSIYEVVFGDKNHGCVPYQMTIVEAEDGGFEAWHGGILHKTCGSAREAADSLRDYWEALPDELKLTFIAYDAKHRVGEESGERQRPRG